MLKPITIPFLSVDKVVPVLKFAFGGREYCGIVDTGAEVTIFGDAFKNYESCEKSRELNLVAFSGEKTSPTKQMAVTLDFFGLRGKRRSMEMIGITSDLSILQDHFKKAGIEPSLQLIIGADMLKKYQVDINFERKKIYFQL